MTYQDVVNDLIELLDKHKMINSWGYGNLSDLTAPFKRDVKTTSRTYDDYGIDYPYAFLNPTNHTLSKNASTYRFNLIMMEMCTDDPNEVIQAQSECHQYIKDVLAHLYYHYGEKYDFTLNSTITPFKEKYNDTVSGMTAALEVVIRDPLDDCIAPFQA
jgi:hypothetical protein